MNDKDGHVISCLMVTQDAARFDMLRRSVDCYLRQDYPDTELVICCDGPAQYQRFLRGYLERQGRGDIRAYYPPAGMTLGEIRNYSVAVARGDYLCQWDDDDLNHPGRLSEQLARLQDSGARVSFFQDQLHYFYTTGELYWVSWDPDLIPGTLMCQKSVLNAHPYPAIARDEDGQLRNRLRDREPIAAIHGRGFLNMYTFHGDNTWGLEHHRSIHASHDPTFMRGREELVRDSLRHFDISEPVLRTSR